jgi:lysophospholipase L1-like esterase
VVMPTIASARPSTDASVSDSPVHDPRLVAAVNGDLAELARRNPGRLTLVDLGSYVCPTGRYQDNVGNVDMARPDGVHYSDAGSDLIGRWLAPQLATIGSSVFAPPSAP